MRLLTIPLLVFYPFRKIKERIVKFEETRVRDKYLPVFESLESILQGKLSSFESFYNAKVKEIENLERLVQDRKNDLEKANEELKVKTRIAESKSSPSHIWGQAFTLGFSKAWDMMLPYMVQGHEKIKEAIEKDTIDSTIENLEPVISNRLKELGLTKLKKENMVLAKRDEIKKDMLREPSKSEKERYECYLEVLEWVLNGNSLQKD